MWQEDIKTIAEGKHVYMGLCPDSIKGSYTRDPDCPACQALGRVADRIRTLEKERNALLEKLDETQSRLNIPNCNIQGLRNEIRIAVKAILKGGKPC